MLIDTRTRGFTLTDGILTHVETRLETALGPFARQVQKVMVRLDDINADRGGNDKRCQVSVALRRRGVVVTEALHEDLYAAIDAAAARARRSVSRELKRHLTRERRDMQRPGALVAF